MVDAKRRFGALAEDIKINGLGVDPDATIRQLRRGLRIFNSTGSIDTSQLVGTVFTGADRDAGKVVALAGAFSREIQTRRGVNRAIRIAAEVWGNTGLAQTPPRRR